ncbi:MAG: hypothetical protein JW915_09235 [Chitinispirillaceae bacterium]|nr:hypothetical protein [Chitinispirillaceae bacterium]
MQLTVSIDMSTLQPVRPDQVNVPIELETGSYSDGTAIGKFYQIDKTIDALTIASIIGSRNIKQGEINASFFRNNLDALQKLFPFKQQPFFTVVDFNLSHQMSYLLAVLAFNKFGSRRNKLIINFDSHDDFRNISKVSFDGWGSAFFNECLQKELSFSKQNRITYMTLGNAQRVWKHLPAVGIALQQYFKGVNGPQEIRRYKADGNVYLTVKRKDEHSPWEIRWSSPLPLMLSDKALDALIECGCIEHVTDHNKNYRLFRILMSMEGVLNPDDTDFDQETFDHFNEEVEALLTLKTWDDCSAMDFLDETIIGNLYDTDVYISIDRDIMKRSCTYWGDGLFDPCQIRSTVEKVMKYLKTKKTNLAGIDIVGLPEKNCTTAYSSHNTDDYLCQARKDIEFVKKMIELYGSTQV